MLSSHTLQCTMLQPVTLLWNVSSLSDCLLMFWRVWFRPLPIYPLLFWHQGLTVGRKQHIAEIADSTWPKKLQILWKNLYDQNHIKTRENQLVNLQFKAACPQSGNPCECWVLSDSRRGREKHHFPIFWISTVVSISTAHICTIKSIGFQLGNASTALSILIWIVTMSSAHVASLEIYYFWLVSSTNY